MTFSSSGNTHQEAVSPVSQSNNDVVLGASAAEVKQHSTLTILRVQLGSQRLTPPKLKETRFSHIPCRSMRKALICRPIHGKRNESRGVKHKGRACRKR